MKNQVFLGSEEFVEEMTQKIEPDKDLNEIPRSQRRKKPGSLDYYFEVSESRNDAIVAAYASGGYSLKQIGDYYGLHYSRKSRIVNQKEAKEKT